MDYPDGPRDARCPDCDGHHPACGAPSGETTGAPDNTPNPWGHMVIVDPDYDPTTGALLSWSVRGCDCDSPWSHAHGTI